jgi:plastocyanin
MILSLETCMRRFLAASPFLAAVLFGGVLAFTAWQGAPEAAATQPVTVSMQSNLFVPGAIWVGAGTEVVWLNEDYESGEFHNVIAANGAFASRNFGPGDAFPFFFDTPGVYEYYCDLHEGMYGTVVVE